MKTFPLRPKTDFDTWATWLTDYLRGHPKHTVLCDDGYFDAFLNWLPHTEAHDTARWTVSAQATHYVIYRPPDFEPEVENFPSPNYGAPPIAFDVIRLGAERLQIRPHCDNAGWLPYLAALLVGMADTWPEIKADLRRAGLLEDDAAQPAQAERDEDAPKPWEIIPDQGWNRKAVELLWRGYSGDVIARQVSVEHKTVLNRLSDLRKIYGAEIVPYLRDKKSG